MDDAEYTDDLEVGEEGFIDYVQDTNDPGAWMMVAVLLYSLCCLLVLPILVILGNRREKARTQDQNWDERSEIQEVKVEIVSKKQEEERIRREKELERSVYVVDQTAGSSIGAIAGTNGGGNVSYEESGTEVELALPSPSASNSKRRRNDEKYRDSALLSPVLSASSADDSVSKLLRKSRAKPKVRFTSQSDIGATRGALNSNGSVASMPLAPTSRNCQSMVSAAASVSSLVENSKSGGRASRRHKRGGARKAQRHDLYSRAIQSEDEYLVQMQGRFGNKLQEINEKSNGGGVADLEIGALGEEQRRRKPISGNSSFDDSMIFGGTVDDLRPEDAADADDEGRELHLFEEENLGEVTICCGPRALWTRRTIVEGADKFLNIAHHDAESKRIVRLGLPLTISEIGGAFFDTLTVALIAQYLGTDDLTAYVVTDLLIGLTDTFVAGVNDALNTVCSHAIGSENYYLAGQYVQISAVIYITFATPLLVFWWFVIGDVMLWLGLGDNIAVIVENYVHIAVFHYLIDGFAEGIFALLDCYDHEVFGAIMDIVEGAAEVLLVWIILAVNQDNGDLELRVIGLVHLCSATFFYLFTMAFVYYKGWLSVFWEGIFFNNAFKNMKAVKNLVNMAIPLSFGSLLEYGEWELLTFFVAGLGPAEVATWGLLGSIWELFEAATEGLGEAAAIRTAYHLGKGNHELAKLSAYKSLFLSVILSIFITSIFFMIGDSLAVWLTTDPVLQDMLYEVVPLIGVGNILMVFGMVSWSLVGAQGRFRLSTIVSIICSWFVTLPLSAISIYVFRFNLKGIAAAVVVGYSTTGLILAYTLIRSDWARISKTIQEYNIAHGLEESDSDDSSSSSSSSSSSDDSDSESDSDSDSDES